MILLDTHVWLWWVGNPAKLSARARATIEHADTLGVCVISCWEIAMLTRRGRLQLDRDILDWVKQALARPHLHLLALTPEIAVRTATLESILPGDPVDRMIVATAEETGASIVTKDRRIRTCKQVRTVW